MERVIAKLTELGWSEDDLIAHLDIVLRQREKNRLKRRAYLQKNKQRLYEYHKKWREAKKLTQ